MFLWVVSEYEGRVSGLIYVCKGKVVVWVSVTGSVSVQGVGKYMLLTLRLLE